MSYEEIKCTHPKARKEHSCCWCGQKILKGEKHMSRAYRFHGTFDADRMHLECEQGMRRSDYHDLSEGWMHGENSRGEPM